MSAVETPSATPKQTDSPKVDAKNNEGKSTPAGDKPAKKRTKKKSKRQPRKNTLKTKVVVRRLPPNLPEKVFMNSVKPWISEETVDYSFYVPGKLSKSKAKESVFSRAYFHLKTMEAVVAFHQGFDGHVFVDSKGVESRAVVEFAPYQKIPKEHKTADVRQGTIDEDQDYLDFLESLKAEENKQPEDANEPADGLTQIERLENRIAMVTAKTLAAEQANKPKTTPLLEHLRAQKAAQAAAKAKAAAKKNARKRAEKASNKKSEQQTQVKVIQQPPQQQPNATQNTTSEGKKKRERNRKKKDTDGTKKTDKEGASNGSATVKPRPPKEPKATKPKEPRPPKEPKEPKVPRPAKEGSNGSPNPKPKKQSNRKPNTEGNSGDKVKQPQTVKILGRQTPNAGNKQTTSG